MKVRKHCISFLIWMNVLLILFNIKRGNCEQFHYKTKYLITEKQREDSPRNSGCIKSLPDKASTIEVKEVIGTIHVSTQNFLIQRELLTEGCKHLLQSQCSQSNLKEMKLLIKSPLASA